MCILSCCVGEDSFLMLICPILHGFCVCLLMMLRFPCCFEAVGSCMCPRLSLSANGFMLEVSSEGGAVAPLSSSHG